MACSTVRAAFILALEVSCTSVSGNSGIVLAMSSNDTPKSVALELFLMAVVLLVGALLVLALTAVQLADAEKALKKKAKQSSANADRAAAANAELARARVALAVRKPVQAGHVVASQSLCGSGVTELRVAADLTIDIPDLGPISVTDIPSDCLAPCIASIVNEVLRIRQTLQRDHEFKMQSALAIARQSFEERLSSLGEGVPADDDWQKLHEQYRRSHLRGSQHGRILSVVYHGHPSGALEIRWKVINPRAAPFCITVSEDDAPVEAVWSDEGRVKRYLEPGRDYAYSFAVRESVHPEAQNLEPDFGFVISIPTEKQWYWEPRNTQKTGREAFEQLKQELTERKEVEEAIDALQLPPDEAERLKARFEAQRFADR